MLRLVPSWRWSYCFLFWGEAFLDWYWSFVLDFCLRNLLVLPKGFQVPLDMTQNACYTTSP